MAIEKKSVLVVGAGPAGLAAAWELVNAGWKVVVLERDAKHVGGLARTMEFKGCRFDIGPHRFYTKNASILRWWRERLGADFVRIARCTRIYYQGKLIHYPLRAVDAFRSLGVVASARCILSYFWRRLFPRRAECSFEDWVVNRFGDRLFHTFFKSYTEKVWGIPCSEISADWASQRIKGLSLKEAVLHAFGKGKVGAKQVRSLVEEFEYPRLGAGQMWEKTRDEIERLGGYIHMGRKVVRIEHDGNRISGVETVTGTGAKELWHADAVVLSMSLKECALGMVPALGKGVALAAQRLRHRHLISVILLVGRTQLFHDNWIYVHDPALKVGRISNYNNWGKNLVPIENISCLGLEYFCSGGDRLWSMTDEDLVLLAKKELEVLGLAKASEVCNGCVVRTAEAYPVYDSNYRENVETIRVALDHFSNLHLAGRNGLHKYNNMDHAMLTGILAARNITDRQSNVWAVNGGVEYLEHTVSYGEVIAPEGHVVQAGRKRVETDPKR